MRAKCLAFIGVFAATALFPGTGSGQASQRAIPAAIVQGLCEKYEGQPLFIAHGDTVQGNCPYIQTMAVIDKPTIIEAYRVILASSRNLAGLRTRVTSDTRCGAFEARKVKDELLVHCTTNLGAGLYPMDFYATAQGDLVRLETNVDYRKVYRAALDRALERGSISKYYDAYIDLQFDLMVNKLNATARPNDRVAVEGSIINVLVGVEKP
jgi:hypothetical protein